MQRDSNALTALGNKSECVYDRIATNLLERFVFDHSSRGDKRMVIALRANEFTSLCPVTGQPDFAVMDIKYRPDLYCVESKSLKLYLGSYRMVGIFHEACVARICDDLAELLDPHWLDVRGEFVPRGDIRLWPEAHYVRK